MAQTVMQRLRGALASVSLPAALPLVPALHADEPCTAQDFAGRFGFVLTSANLPQARSERLQQAVPSVLWESPTTRAVLDTLNSHW